MTARHLLGPLTALALATLAGAGCREGQAIDDVSEQPAPGAEDDFNYQDVDDAEQAVDDSIEDIGGREAPDVPIDAEERARRDVR